MIPYASFTYFGILLYPIIPLLILGLSGRYGFDLASRLARRWAAISVVGMLLVQYWTDITIWPGTMVLELWLVLGYAVYQTLITRAYLAARRSGGTSIIFVCTLALTVLPLVAVKVSPVVAPGSMLGFLGISYVSFRALDVILSIHDDVIQDLPVWHLLVFLLFFPTISSGPIDRYTRFIRDWKRFRGRAQFLQDLDTAVHHVFTGFLYKFVLAVLIKQYLLDPVNSVDGLLGILGSMYAYSLYLFFDFAGYSAFAVGIGYIFGVRTPENFHYPFLAPNIREFWNRWHITLSWWFRDHVYTRFVLAATRRNWFTNRFQASYAGFVLSFGLMGLWHGLAANFVLYGLYHAVLLIGFDIFQRKKRVYRLWGDSRAWQVGAVILTFHAVCFGFLLFSGRIV